QRQQSSESEALANGEPRAIDFAAKLPDHRFGQRAAGESGGKNQQTVDPGDGGQPRSAAVAQPLVQHEPTKAFLGRQKYIASNLGLPHAHRFTAHILNQPNISEK
ncbi:MAG: hypothetical protein Q9205_005351, partial [Flavoplaca limonia]